jgi:hypothetical protein
LMHKKTSPSIRLPCIGKQILFSFSLFKLIYSRGKYIENNPNASNLFNI